MSGKITQEVAQKIIDEFCEGSSSYELADKYGLWHTSICNLISGRTWKQCKRPDNIKELIDQRHCKGLFKKGMKCHIDAPPLTDLQMDIIVGSLLGDGSIKTGSANCNFSKQQCVKHKEYIDWHYDVFDSYSSKVLERWSDDKPIGGKRGKIVKREKVEKRLVSYTFYTHQHPVFTELRGKWYDKRKIIPSNLELNERRIAIWYCDDGSNSYDNRQVAMCTQSFTFEEVEFLKEKLGDFDLKPSILKVWSTYTEKFMPILKFDSTSYDNLIELVKPYILWPCFQHKIKWRRALERWEISGKFTEDSVIKIFKLSKTHKQYQIAEMFGVHKNVISALLRGDTYLHLQHLNPYIPKSIRSPKKVNIKLLGDKYDT